MGRQRVYPSDLTDEQWEIIEPMLPLIKEPGRIPKRPFRDIVDAILYIDRSGCSWRQLPVDFPPWQARRGLVHHRSSKPSSGSAQKRRNTTSMHER
ncbi:transposase [Paractinoplanes tereljensis]|uniref:transposase n=1 Tax=Paractinoplanes tereljensis TaxID=571912 RepID=UPI001945A63F